jgi:hypothetical protein
MTLPCVYASSGILPGRDGPSGVVVSIVAANFSLRAGPVECRRFTPR